MTIPAPEDPAYEARTQIRLAVYRIAGNCGDPRHVDHDPLAALRVLVCLRTAVTQAERDAARRAREGGRSWREIGEALGRPDPDVAFLHVAEHAGRYPSLAWRCPDCGETVIDYGPPQSAAGEAERGHAEGCERFAATMREDGGGD